MYSITCLCWSNYILILDFTPGFNGLGKDKCKTWWEILSFVIWCNLYWRFGRIYEIIEMVINFIKLCWDQCWLGMRKSGQLYFYHSIPGILLCMLPSNERRRYVVTSSLIGWAHTQNENNPCIQTWSLIFDWYCVWLYISHCVVTHVNSLRPSDACMRR